MATNTLWVTLLGDSQEREYPIRWMGTGEISEKGAAPIIAPLALIYDKHKHEVAVYFDPDYGWVLLGGAGLRAITPKIAEERLRVARYWARRIPA
jgi:hypothetical protein